MSYKYENIRNFYFENELGERIDCQKINGNLFFYNVTGLGYEEEIEYFQSGNNFIPNKKNIVQNQISGELEFYDMTYDEYSDFVNFILQASELKLIYVPKKTVRKEYYRDIDLFKIDKAEEDDYNVLTCPISMNAKSLWYEKNENVYDVTAQANEMRYDYRWDSRYTTYDKRSLVYNNKGHVEAPFVVEIDGYIVNPEIQIIVDKEIIADLKIPITIDEYEKFLFSSKAGEIYIRKQKADGTTENLFKKQYIDISKNNIFKLPIGVSKIKLVADEEITSAKITIYPEYKAV